MIKRISIPPSTAIDIENPKRGRRRILVHRNRDLEPHILKSNRSILPKKLIALKENNQIEAGNGLSLP